MSAKYPSFCFSYRHLFATRDRHMTCTPSRDIEPGEQLTFSYTGDSQTAAFYEGIPDGECRCYSCLRSRGQGSLANRIIEQGRRFAMHRPSRDGQGVHIPAEAGE